MKDASITEPENFDLRSHDVAGDKVQELLRLFPEIRTDAGKLDFDRLKLALGESVDAGKERYGMNWPGKAECSKTIQASSLGTLRPCPEESINFENTDNLIIEGDNLEVLKLLQKSYLGKVKMIYIDPPYNTGNDFIYPDNFSESLQTYLEYTGQVDSERRRFGTNTEADGRFHSKWMNMMYPRLYLARNLLADDGVILVSIDEHELTNLHLILNEVFGEENEITLITWEKGRKNDSTFFSESVEYVLVYGKNRELLRQKGVWREKKPRIDEVLTHYKQLRAKLSSDHETITDEMVDFFRSLDRNDPAKKLSHFHYSDDRGLYFRDNISSASTSIPDYEVIHPVTGKPCKKPERGWGCTEPVMLQRIREGRVHFGEDETTGPNKKTYLEEVDSICKTPVIYKDGRAATRLLRSLLGATIFENPKDHEILSELFAYASSSDALILDFFAGSCSTAHAVLSLNKQDGGNRKFIMVQLPEPTDENSTARKNGYATIADIGKERMRRVVDELNRNGNGKLPLIADSAIGFRVFNLAESNFTTWNTQVPHEDSAIERQLDLHIDHIRSERTPDDILCELLLKSGFPLTTPVEKQTLFTKTIYNVANGSLVICLERELTLELIRAIADKKPVRVVCLDEGFAGNDQLKANAVQTFKTKGITSFKTV